MAARKKVIAEVGRSTPPTRDDLLRLSSVLEHLPHSHGMAAEAINLEKGRDFLTETHTYHAVVVHSVFHTSMSGSLEQARKSGRIKVSEHHTIENWCKRLVATKAETIIVIEGIPFSLNGWQLGELKGYTIVKRDHYVTVYRRKKGRAT